MKIEKGMFARSEGEIFKISAVWIDSNMSRVQGDYGVYFMHEIEKVSFNIIDLIEVGDYVNGYKVSLVCDDELRIYTEDDVFYFENNDIKSIITREQFKEMEYKVND